MSYLAIACAVSLGLSLALLASMALGRFIGKRHLASGAEITGGELGAVEGMVFALLGLLIAFTFSGAAERLDVRRRLVVQEANAIGTAYLRLDLLPADTQPALRESFRQYVDARLSAYRQLPDLDAFQTEAARATALQRVIWARAVEASRSSELSAPTMLLLPALNEMIDITATRTAAGSMHPPVVVYGVLIGLALTAAVFAGYDGATGRARGTLHKAGFVIIIALTLYLILDLELPRFGLIRVDGFDTLLVEVRQGMD